MIKHIQKSDIPIIADIHIKTLKGDFLPSLGKNFLETMYQGLINKKDIYSFKFLEKKEIAGFIIGTKNMDQFFKTALKASFIKLAFFLFLEILKNSAIIKKIL